MKKYIIFLLFSGISISLFGQRPMQERVEAQRVAHITDALKLNSKESQNFWPIYNDYMDEQQNLRKSKFQEGLTRKEMHNLSDAAARKHINDMLDTEEEMVRLKRKYYNKFLEVLPAAKVAMLPEAERSFREMVLRRVSERMQDRRQRNFQNRNE